MDNTNRLPILPDYQASLEWIEKLLNSYGNTGRLLTDENKGKLFLEGDWEIEDTEDLVGGVIVPTNPWYLLLGNRNYLVKGIYLNTDNNWSQWSLSMVSQDEKPTWHSLDARVLMDRPYQK